MICGVHGLIGAALGKVLKDKKLAFIAGVASHFVADMIPHRDLSVEAESVLAAGSLAAITATQGTASAAFWGALGAMLPDTENAINYLRGEGRYFFPSHTDRHGPKVGEIISQVGIALICLAILLDSENKKKT